jgi:hypothetical protein
MQRRISSRFGHRALVVAGIALLTGCVYDPYTGGYYPAGNYPPGHAAYAAGAPPPGGESYEPSPQGGMSAPPPGGGYTTIPGAGPGGPAPGAMGEPEGPRGGYYAAGGGGHGGMAARFAAANVTGDGRLTREQAMAAGWRRVARYFDTIDVQHKGYVTLADIRAWRASHPRMQAGGARGYPATGGGAGYGAPGEYGGFASPPLGGGYGGPGY